MKIFAFVVLAASAAALAQAPPRGEPPPPPDSAPPPGGAQPRMQLPDKFTNLKILPKDIDKNDLIRTMRTFSQSLGVRCDHCHVLQQDKKDFASDAKREKQTARNMMKMVHRLNADFFDYKDAPKATCFMCHHGEHKPLLTPPPQPADGPGEAPSPGGMPPPDGPRP
jgi:hypothetical protein